MLDGDNVVTRFIECLQQEAASIFKEYIINPKPMDPLTAEQQREYDMATKCHICSEEIDDEDEENHKVRDHCHILGHYRGPAHNSCNLNYNIKPKLWKLPVFFHNLRGYDSHLIIKHLNESHGKIRAIPNNMNPIWRLV